MVKRQKYFSSEGVTMVDQVTNFYIYVADKPLPSNYASHLHSLTVESSLNLPSIAEFTLLDNDLKFIDDEELLVPGKSLQIYARENRGSQIFDGEIVELEPNFQSPHKYCVVRGFDRLHWLMRGQLTKDYINQSDSSIATEIIGTDCKPLNPVVQSTSPVHRYVFKDNETNLSFLQRRAALLGFVIYADGKDIHFEAPKSREEIELTWSADGLSNFRPRLSTLDQPTEVTARAIDMATGKVLVGKAGVGTGQPEVGEPKDRVAMAKTLSVGQSPSDGNKAVISTAVRDSSDVTQKHVDNLASSEANRRSSDYIQAEGTCGGNPQIVAGTKIKISNIGKRFGGSYVVSSATHIFDSQKNYTTHFNVTGTHVQTLQHLLGHRPQPRYGFVVGIVDEVEGDPEHLCRVKVLYTGLDDKSKSNWARVVSVGGGNNRGIEFLPENGDEVLIGFENGDVHAPYVLGGVWNKVNVPPELDTSIVEGGKVKRRIIRSRMGHTITLDDSDSTLGITVDDGKGGKIHIDTKKKTMTLEAENGIEIKSKKITINGSSTVLIDGGAIEIGR